MKHIATIILVVLIFIIMGLYFVSFQVRQTEAALVTTFGKPTREITEPRSLPYFKWPTPIQRVYKFDSRMRVLEADLGETTTKGAVPIIVHTYVVWRIAEPLKFFKAVETIKEAESKLLSQISDTRNRIVGQHSFSEFVNSDPAKTRFEEIQNEMHADLKGPVRENYGIEIETLGIKQLKISEDVTKDVFDRMKAERSRRTQKTIAQGKAEATKIRTDAEKKTTQLLAAAEARAKVIRGQGDAEAAKYYKMLEADTELAMLLRNLEALEKILDKETTFVVPTDKEPFILLKEIPDIKPKRPE